MKLFTLLTALFLIASSCGFNKPGSQSASSTNVPEPINSDVNSHVVTLTEIIQTSSYSYVKLKEGNKEYWAALPGFDGKVGQTYYYNQGMEMKEFKSKELNRTFSSIWFLEGLSDKPMTTANQHAMTTTGRQIVNRVPNVSVNPAAGGLTISKLLSEKAQYANKKIIVRGQVVKFSPEIMNKNWIHLQDGTEASGEYDLVITTGEVVKVGDVVTFEGVIATDKDFGYGYKYDVIMEDAKISKQ
jgi:hypothetical protein